MNQSKRVGRAPAIATCILAAAGISAAAWATMPFNVLVNEILAMGTANDDLHEHVHVREVGAGDGDEEDWELKLHTQGASDFYIQDVEIAPGGYSGWHSHPGVFIGTVIAGSVDFYNANCEKQTFTAGQVWTENTELHAIANHGAVNNHLQFAYLIKKGMPRRIDRSAPDCAPSTGIP
jgi:quercetin dioxygenase-like cupin family protein